MTVQVCALCKQLSRLEMSHIIPDFFYRPLFEEGYAVELDVLRKTEARRRSGYSEPLLCSDCEDRMSKLESYFADVWQNPAKRMRPEIIREGKLVISGFDYARFKLFHMSVLWRMGVATLRPFSNVKLGLRAERLRQMLVEEDPGEPDEFGLFASGLRDPETSGWQEGIVHAPRAAKIECQWIYSVVFGGARWHYFASKHIVGRTIPAQLTRQGELTVVIHDWSKDPHLQAAAPVIPQLTRRMRGARGSS